MDRKRLLCVGVSLLLAGALVTTGCTNLLFTALYVVKGTDVEPEFPGLKEKTVVVVCRSPADLQFSNATVPREIAAVVGRILETNVRKVSVIRAEEVDQWMDEHTWNDFREIGEALDAQMVVAIDLQSFGLYKGQTLYQGRAAYSFQVIDVEEEGQMVFRRDPPQSLWPPNTPIPTSEKTEAQFRREFVNVLADEIARTFYPHDPNSLYAADAKALD